MSLEITRASYISAAPNTSTRASPALQRQPHSSSDSTEEGKAVSPGQCWCRGSLVAERGRCPKPRSSLMPGA